MVSPPRKQGCLTFMTVVRVPGHYSALPSETRVQNMASLNNLACAAG